MLELAVFAEKIAEVPKRSFMRLVGRPVSQSQFRAGFMILDNNL
jgi:hypothetical protein